MLAYLDDAFFEDWRSWEAEVFRENLTLLPTLTDLDADHWMPLGWAMRLLADEQDSLIIPARIRRAKPAKDDEESSANTFMRTVLGRVDEAMKRAALDEEGPVCASDSNLEQSTFHGKPDTC
ncbi:MAG: hypothetical protein ACI8T1_004133 [Verrucomicrobiales bacterium]